MTRVVLFCCFFPPKHWFKHDNSLAELIESLKMGFKILFEHKLVSHTCCSDTPVTSN